ncbi:MAG: SDR family oxidoreductase [Candidatus Margulisbacteria bacterium]|nr:SDR family oxidoreductase [Candidatus Margulisiibacteriota bacterium]
MKNQSIGKQTALITGPTSGIGYELALLFAKDGYNLILAARTKQKLEQMKADLEKKFAITVHIIAIDLSKPDSPKQLYEQLIKQEVKIDILVNNAGFGNYGFFCQTDLDVDLELLQLNIVTPTILTKLISADMIKRRQGKILNVGSVASFFAGPYMNTYFASKNYILSFSLALHCELKSAGVSVSCLCPGPTQTNFGNRAHFHHKLNRRHIMDVKKVAETGYRGLFKNKAIVIPGFQNKLIIFSARFAPRLLLTKMVKKLSGF